MGTCILWSLAALGGLTLLGLVGMLCAEEHDEYDD